MVAATQKQQQQQQSQPEAQPAAATSAEEEVLKRNTDCVYFLASPLTCKKGSECEYRHSDYARINPRDCYYWLNGNCLNPKCGFRHPPLDGLYGNQAAASAGSTLPPPHTATLPSVHTPYNSGKQPVPCIFFQKGFCLKGDKCAFLHGPNPASNKVSLPTAPSNSIEPTPVKKPFGSLQKCTQEQKASCANMSKTAEPNEARAVKKAEFASSRNGVGGERDVRQPKSIDDVPRHKATTLPTIPNENSTRSNRLHQSQIEEDHGFQNDKDADDHYRDSSPGFDVLVDDELREAEYYHGEDHLIGREGRNSKSMDNYDMGHSADYSSMADIDQETYHDPRGYDSYERMQGYAWEQHRVSSDRMIVGATHLERGGYPISDSPEHIEDSELRYRLSKERRGGLRSVVSHDFVQENQTDDQGHRRSHRLPSHDSSISSRLRGRIKLPGRSLNDGGDLHVEREMNRGRIWGRLSPGRTHPGRLRDRIKGRLEEDYNPEGRNLRGHRIIRELIDDSNTDFSGPKSLAELKEGKNAEVGSQQILGKRKQLESQQPEDLSFEGPLSLSEILKRKREAEGTAVGSGIQLTNKDDDNQKERKESLSSSNNARAPNALSSHLKDENNNGIPEGKRESKSAMTETDEVENVDVADDQSLQPTLNEFGTDDGIIGDDGMEYNEYEGEEQRDGDYEYEQDYEGEYNYEEGENAEVEEEYVDEEDGDDFAKKMGAVLS